MYTLEERRNILENDSLTTQRFGRWHPLQRYATGGMANVALTRPKPSLVVAEDGKTSVYKEKRIITECDNRSQVVAWQECVFAKDDNNDPYLEKTIEYSLI